MKKSRFSEEQIIGFLRQAEAIMPFFKTGPFAWNGILSYWIPASAFGTWFYVMAYQMLKAIRRQGQAA